MDAAVMEGRDLNYGGVMCIGKVSATNNFQTLFQILSREICLLYFNNFLMNNFTENIKNPILVAEKVATSSRHCLFAGEGAVKFAVKQGGITVLYCTSHYCTLQSNPVVLNQGAAAHLGALKNSRGPRISFFSTVLLINYSQGCSFSNKGSLELKKVEKH
jgi:hypothetical protein